MIVRALFLCAHVLQPGDYIKFVNLHATEYKQVDQSARPTIELCLHRGTSYGRCVQVVSPDCTDLKVMKQRLEMITSKNASSASTGLMSRNDQPAREPTDSLQMADSIPSSAKGEFSGRLRKCQIALQSICQIDYCCWKGNGS